MHRGLSAVVVASACLASACLASAVSASAETLKIGLVTTLSGPGGVIGRHQRDGADLALQKLGGKLGGVDAEILYGDDQARPDIGRQVVDGMLKRDKVRFVTGFVFSNVLLSVYRPVLKEGAILLSASAGPSELAGTQCAANFFATSWQNDQSAETMGIELNKEKIDSVVILAPNYAAGRDMLAGFKRTYQGKVLAEIYTNFSQADYQAELSRIQSLAPKATFAFYPGGLGIQFVKQYAQAGLKGQIPLYTVYTQNETTLGAMGTASEGNFEVGSWGPTVDNPANKAFVSEFEKKYAYIPSDYAAVSFDTINLIDGAMKELHGNATDQSAIVKALEKADFRSVRGEFRFNTNHFPIQDFYLFKIQAKGGGEPEFRSMQGKVAASYADGYAKDCRIK